MQSFRNFAISFLTAFCITALIFGTVAVIVVPKMASDITGSSDNSKKDQSDLVIGFEPATDENVNTDDSTGFSVLLVGTDKRPTKSESEVDSLIFVKVCPAKKTVVFLPIPTNMRVTVDDSIVPLSSLRTLKNMDYLCEKVTGLIGTNINYYAIASLTSFKRIINDLGGVEYTVSEDMKFVDEADDLNIDIPKGNQIMDGEASTEYLRYSSDGFGERMLRNVNFLKTIIRKYTNEQYRSQAGSLFAKVGENITTDFTETDLAQYIDIIYGYPSYDEKDIVFPGEYVKDDQGGTYFEANTSLAYELLAEYK